MSWSFCNIFSYQVFFSLSPKVKNTFILYIFTFITIYYIYLFFYYHNLLFSKFRITPLVQLIVTQRLMSVFRFLKGILLFQEFFFFFCLNYGLVFMGNIQESVGICFNIYHCYNQCLKYVFKHWMWILTVCRSRLKIINVMNPTMMKMGRRLVHARMNPMKSPVIHNKIIKTLYTSVYHMIAHKISMMNL